MQEVDFTGADLTAAVFQNCNLQNAIFEQTNLSAADLSGAQYLLLDPEQNKIKKAKMLLEQLPGLLSRHQIVLV